MSTIAEWVSKNTFHCPHLEARITPTQCKINRNNAKTNGTHDKSVHPCVKCESYEEYQQEVLMKSDSEESINLHGEVSISQDEILESKIVPKCEYVDYLKGLEDCEIYNSRLKTGKNFLSVFKNHTAAISASLREQFDRIFTHVLIGYNRNEDILKIKMFTEKVPESQRMFKQNGNFHMQGAAKRFGLDKRMKGKRFKAELADNNIILVYLSEEV